MDWLQIVLRSVHIVSGIAWVGGAALFFFYIEPAMNKLGPDAEKFVHEVIVRRKAPIYFVVSSTLTVVFGLVLYWRDSGGLQLAWIQSPTGLTFTIAAIAALIAWAGGNLLIPRTLMRLQAIGGRMKEAVGPPPATLLSELHATQARLRMIGMIDLLLLVIAAVGMAAARYVR